MKCRISLMLVLVLVVGLPLLHAPVYAQSEPDAATNYALHLRSGPGSDYAVITTLDAGQGVNLIARNSDTAWVLAVTEDGARRGWLASLYLTYRDGVAPANLPVSDEVITGMEPLVIQQLRQTPVVAAATGRAAAIFQAGLARGNHPDRFSKVGDCQNIPSFFLGVYDRGEYNLGSEYAYLQDTITRFAGSFARESAAVWSGFNVYAVLDPTWADPSICGAGESPIECEYRIWQPSFVIISLEVWHGAPELYWDNLRQVLDFWISKDVVPILATKADNDEDDWSINVAIASLAWEYDVPLWNFFMAAQPLPNHGLQVDGFHLTYAQCNFESETALQNAWPWRNLTALQSLDAVRRGVGG